MNIKGPGPKIHSRDRCITGNELLIHVILTVTFNILTGKQHSAGSNNFEL
jgi:hypothetical protein